MKAYLVFSDDDLSLPAETSDVDVLDEAPADAVLQIKSFDFGLRRKVERGVLQGVAKAKLFSAVKQMAGSSVLLLTSLDRGMRFSQVWLLLRNEHEETGALETHATWRFTDVVISDQEWNGLAGNRVGSETIAFRYQTLGLQVDGTEAEVDLGGP